MYLLSKNTFSAGKKKGNEKLTRTFFQEPTCRLFEKLLEMMGEAYRGAPVISELWVAKAPP